MSLFMNMIEHPEMFMNTEEIPTSNQRYYKYDSFSELMKSQEQVNTSLQSSIRLIEKVYFEQQYDQINRWEEISDQLVKLSKNDYERNEFEKNVMNRLNKLDEHRKQVEEMLVNETHLKEEFTVNINEMIASHEKLITEKLNQFSTSHEKLSTQLAELHALQQDMTEKVTDQIEEQTNIKERLENQEALMEKVSRQLTHFRSILYERTNVLAEKIEESYEITSSYLYQLLTGSKEPFSAFLIKQKKKQIKMK